MGSRRNDTLEQGSNGHEVIDDTAAHTGTFGGLLVLNDAVISAITTKGVTNSSGMTTITLREGLYYPFEFTSITLTSGVVAAYHDYA